MPVKKVKYTKSARTKDLFKELHGMSLADVAAQAAFPPKVENPKKDLPFLTVVGEPVPNAEPTDNTGTTEQGAAFDFAPAETANPS